MRTKLSLLCLENCTLKLHQSKIKESNKIKYLGVYLDKNLSWNFHITELCKKQSCAVGMLYKMKNMCSTSTLRSIYFSIFHSHLSYSIPIWGLAYLHKKLYYYKNEQYV